VVGSVQAFVHRDPEHLAPPFGIVNTDDVHTRGVSPIHEEPIVGVDIWSPETV
jgi:hypothetical protein